MAVARKNSFHAVQAMLKPFRLQGKFYGITGTGNLNLPSCFLGRILPSCPPQTQSRTFAKASAAKLEEKQVRRKQFISSEMEPSKQSEENFSQFYTIPKDIAKSSLGECLPRKFIQQSSMLGETSMMIRRPSLKVIQELSRVSAEELPPPRFIFYGPDGCGKTLSLSHVVHYCVSTGWLLLLVPSVFSWVHSKVPLQMSTYRPGRFDQAEQASRWLQLFRRVNNNFLAEMKTTNKYLWGKRESTALGEPLAKVIDQGQKRPNFATDAVGVLLKEIKYQKRLKVLFAVDEFNGFFRKTSFKDAKQKWVKPDSLSLVHHFTKLLDPTVGLTRGAMVFSLSRTGIERSHIKSSEVNDLIGEEGEAVVGPHEPVNVPPYSHEEFESCLQFYRDNGVLARELNTRALKEIAFLTGRQPRLVSSLCNSH